MFPTHALHVSKSAKNCATVIVSMYRMLNSYSAYLLCVMLPLLLYAAGVLQFPPWVMCIMGTAIVLLVVFLLRYFWPTIMYNFNLYHSKSLPYSDVFMGREKEMEEMMQFVNFRNPDTRIVNIVGSPGFGKSTLAINVGHEVVRNGDMVHYVNMADFPSKADVKIVLCEKIFDSARVVAKNISFEGLLRWARRQFYNSLLILDNCDDVIHNQKKEFQDVVKRLVEESMSIKVVITSREIVPFAQSYHECFRVDELSATNAQMLLKSRVSSRVSLTQGETEEVAKLTGNVPLALQIIGSLLRLPGSTTPSTVINELAVEPMEVLSPPSFPADKQIFNSIGLSYKYLPKELQKVGRQLTIFPGSFTLYAAMDIVCGTDFLSCPPVTFALQDLVWSSLLERNQRTGRFQYHRLIREYFMYVQNKEEPSEAAQILPNFHIHYSNELKSISEKRKSEYELTLAFVDSERHNIQYLLELIPSETLPTKDFLVGVMALSKAIDAGLLRSRFSKADLCVTLKTSLSRLDYVIELNQLDDGQELVPHYSEEAILAQYLTMIKQVAICVEDTDGISAAIYVYSYYRSTVEQRSLDIDPVQYTDYFTVLCNYYSQHGSERQAISCHRSIIRRTNAHLATCNPSECNYYDIGDAYYNMHEYQKAAELFEWALGYRGDEFGVLKSRLSLDNLEHLKILMKLYYTYNNLKEYEKAALALSNINVLRPKVLETSSEKLFNSSDTVQTAVSLFKNLGYTRDAMMLEEKLLSALRDVGLKAVHKPWELSLSWQIDRKKKVPLDIAYNVVHRLYENAEYVKTIKMITYFIDILKNTTDFRKEVILFHALLGKAMFSIGNYSEGMNKMEFALNIIQSLEKPFLYEQTRSTACWYLIPRVRHIETCYNVSQLPLKMLRHHITSSVLYLIFSPYPFTLPNIILQFRTMYKNLHFWPSSTTSQSSEVKLASSTTSQSSEVKLASYPGFEPGYEAKVKPAATWYFGALSTTIDDVCTFTTSVVDDHLRMVQYSITTVLLNIIIMIYYILCIPIWIIIVWIKLLFLLSFRYSSRMTTARYYLTSVPFIIFNALLNSKERPNLRLLLLCVRDPRFVSLCVYPELDANTESQRRLRSLLLFSVTLSLSCKFCKYYYDNM